MKSAKFFFAISLLMVSSASAGPKPTLYPNAHFKSVGQVRADRDIIECQVQAEDALGGKTTKTKGDSVRQGVGGAVKGAALGAIAGTITKSGAGRGAGAGAAIGGITGTAGGRRERKAEEAGGSPEYRKYVEACLDDKGYKVVGWK